MEKKYTPGPWSYSQYWIWRPSQQAGEVIKQPQIAYVGYGHDGKGEMDEEQTSNAHLMAASPIMLEALEEMYIAVENFAEADLAGDITELAKCKIKILKASFKVKLAISKAYGQTKDIIQS